jgi:hypothetical protein
MTFQWRNWQCSDTADARLALSGFRPSALTAKQSEADTSEVPATSALARAIKRFAQTDGDHNTAIPALTLHRRKAPTEPLHCIYNLGLGVVAQGDKQVMLGGESIDYGRGNPC